MIYEYALAPEFLFELLDKKDLITNLRRVLRIGQGCGLSTYPNELEKEVFKLVTLKEKQASNESKKAKWQQLKHDLPDMLRLATRIRRFNAMPWKGTFADEHHRFPFHTILSQQTDEQSTLPIKNLDWLRNFNCPMFGHSHETPTRSPDELCSTLTPLLQNASEICFIEPYFSAEDRFKKVYKLYFKAIESACSIRTTNGTREVSIICSAAIKTGHQEMTPSEFKRSCDTYRSILPQDFILTFYRIREVAGQQEIHDRYILTDIGGVQIGHGTDANTCPATTSCANITLLDFSSLQKWRAEYYPSSTVFDWSEPPVIIYG